MTTTAHTEPADQEHPVTDTARCTAAHPEDPTGCDDGPADAVLILDRQQHGTDGCEHHGARLLASLTGAHAVSGPTAPGAAIRVTKVAVGLAPFCWQEAGPRLEAAQPSLAAVAGCATVLDPAVLYRHAPDLLIEAHELLTLSSRFLTQTLAGEPNDPEELRAYLLRRAVQSDRVEAGGMFGETASRTQAEESFRLLADLDRAHPWLVPAGLTVPGVTAPYEELRAYVRGSYDVSPWT
ncbi:hypothetical protein [Streptomyces sp. NPDC059979]|uniref:hypothetical protein n=1 Tax=Streptomyces sp. NPDC059979 TaxID=3347021 RepID=UPI0036ACB824